MKESNPTSASPSIPRLCELMRVRSSGNNTALGALQAARLPGHMVGILRQELDSMIRAMFLLSINALDERENIAQRLLDGNGLRKTTGGRIQDREMLDLATRLHNWAEYVYRFGCAFLHLSHLHDLQSADPLRDLPAQERNDVIRYLRQYHGGPVREDAGFDDIVPLLPCILRKISDNLLCYLRELERGGSLD